MHHLSHLTKIPKHSMV